MHIWRIDEPEKSAAFHRHFHCFEESLNFGFDRLSFSSLLLFTCSYSTDLIDTYPLPNSCSSDKQSEDRASTKRNSPHPQLFCSYRLCPSQPPTSLRGTQSLLPEKGEPPNISTQRASERRGPINFHMQKSCLERVCHEPSHSCLLSWKECVHSKAWVCTQGEVLFLCTCGNNNPRLIPSHRGPWNQNTAAWGCRSQPDTLV